MRVLVACEFSGIVRDAFRARGHDAISCDLLPSERPGPHIVGDALAAIRDIRPDLLIAHPPCTYLTLAGVRWLYTGGRGTVPDAARWESMREGARLFAALLSADVPMVAVENPIMHRYGFLWEVVSTVLWLRGLPKLEPSEIVEGRTARVHGRVRDRIGGRNAAGRFPASRRRWPPSGEGRKFEPVA